MKTYEVRYHSELVNGMALYGVYQTIEAARQAATEFMQTIRERCGDPRMKAGYIKSIEIW